MVDKILTYACAGSTPQETPYQGDVLTMSTLGFPPVRFGIPLDPVKQEVLSLLRWSILGSIEDIEIETRSDQDGLEECHPFLSHPLAKESLTLPPVNRIQIISRDIFEARHFYLAPEDYQYEAKTIENADGSPITIKDFVIQVHNHLSQHRDIILNYRKMGGFND